MMHAQIKSSIVASFSLAPLYQSKFLFYSLYCIERRIYIYTGEENPWSTLIPLSFCTHLYTDRVFTIFLQQQPVESTFPVHLLIICICIKRLLLFIDPLACQGRCLSSAVQKIPQSCLVVGIILFVLKYKSEWLPVAMQLNC
jgi:hypothetical protein